MTAKELAEMLTGREVGSEIGGPVVDRAKESGLVVVYGYSDDNVEFAGAIDEEVGAYEGTRIYLAADGLLMEPGCAGIEDCDCPYFNKAKSSAKIIEAIWHDEGGPCWTFATHIPHETFTIMEDGAPWCIGIVFSMADLGVTV